MKALLQKKRRPLLDWLVTAARAGERCPTNDLIARRFDLSSPSDASELIALMEAEGDIRVERFINARVVHLVAAGLSTARPASTRPHPRALKRPLPAPTPPPSAAASPGKPRISAAVIRAAQVDGRDLPTFVTALIDMGLECWRDDRAVAGEELA